MTYCFISRPQRSFGHVAGDTGKNEVEAFFVAGHTIGRSTSQRTTAVRGAESPKPERVFADTRTARNGNIPSARTSRRSRTFAKVFESFDESQGMNRLRQKHKFISSPLGILKNLGSSGLARKERHFGGGIPAFFPPASFPELGQRHGSAGAKELLDSAKGMDPYGG